MESNAISAQLILFLSLFWLGLISAEQVALVEISLQGRQGISNTLRGEVVEGSLSNKSPDGRENDNLKGDLRLVSRLNWNVIVVNVGGWSITQFSDKTYPCQSNWTHYTRYNFLHQPHQVDSLGGKKQFYCRVRIDLVTHHFIHIFSLAAWRWNPTCRRSWAQGWQ